VTRPHTNFLVEGFSRRRHLSAEALAKEDDNAIRVNAFPPFPPPNNQLKVAATTTQSALRTPHKPRDEQISRPIRLSQFS
jgi:hypothetical protein